MNYFYSKFLYNRCFLDTGIISGVYAIILSIGINDKDEGTAKMDFHGIYNCGIFDLEMT